MEESQIFILNAMNQKKHHIIAETVIYNGDPDHFPTVSEKIQATKVVLLVLKAYYLVNLCKSAHGSQIQAFKSLTSSGITCRDIKNTWVTYILKGYWEGKANT